jgi:hypothetical protein
MPRPTSIADFGTQVAPAHPPASACTAASHHRFADVIAYTKKAMPTVLVGEYYADLDPRSQDRVVQVIATDASTAVVRTITPRSCPPRTAAKTSRATTGTITRIALRRFRPNSRGFSRLTSDSETAHAFVLASRIAAGCNIAVTENEMRTARALIALIGTSVACDYLDDISVYEDGIQDAYIDGAASLIPEALLFAQEVLDNPRRLASAATARQVARLT